MAESKSANNSRNRTPEEFSEAYLRAIEKHPGAAAKIAPKIKDDVKLRLEQIVGELDQKGVPVGAESWAQIANFLHETLKDDSFNRLREPLDREFRKLFGGIVQKKIEAASKVMGQSEKELENYVVQNLSKIKPGLKFVARQRKMPDGSRLDVQADDGGVQTILELKGHDWNASNRDNVMELQGEVNKYLNQIDNSKAIIIVPKYSVEIHASLKNRINEQKVSAYTHRRLEDCSYEFSQVDFGFFEELIRSGASKLTQPEPQEKTIETTIGFTVPQELSQQPQGFTIRELLPRSIGKPRAQKKKPKVFAPEEPKAAKPAVSEKERITISNYLTKLEQLVGAPNPVPAKIRNYLDDLWKSLPENEDSINVRLEDAPADYLRSLFSGWDPKLMFLLKEISDSKYNAAWYCLYPLKIMPIIFDVFDFRMSKLTEFSNELNSEAKCFLDYVDKGLAPLNSKEPAEQTEADRKLVKTLEGMKKDVSILTCLDTARNTIFSSRLETLKKLRDIWPYEPSKNWPLAAYYAILFVNKPKNKMMSYDLHDYSDETLRHIVSYAFQLFNTRGAIKCGEEDVLGGQPLKAMSECLLFQQKIPISKKQYSRLIMLKENYSFEKLVEIVRKKDKSASNQPAPLEIFELYDESFKHEYSLFLNEYSEIYKEISAKYDVEGISNDLEITTHWRKQAEKDVAVIEKFAERARRSRVYRELMNEGKDDPYKEQAANSMLVVLERARRTCALDNFIKQEALCKLNKDVALQYMDSYLGDQCQLKSIDAFLDFIDAEKIIYDSIVSSCFEIQRKQEPAAEKPAVLQQNLEQEKLFHSQLYELVLPSKYRSWISEDAKNYIQNFVSNDLNLLKLSEEKKMQLAEEIKHSKWYAPLHDKEMPDDKLYLFFDKMFLQIYNEKNDGKDKSVPTRHEIAKYFQSVCVPALKQKPLNNQSQL
jgi:hypothetical protein